MPLERVVEHLVLEVPLPPPGKLRVEFGLHAGGARFGYCRPPLNRLPLADLSPPRCPQQHFFFFRTERARCIAQRTARILIPS